MKPCRSPKFRTPLIPDQIRGCLGGKAERIQVGVLHHEAEPHRRPLGNGERVPVSPLDRLLNMISDQFLRVAQVVAFDRPSVERLDFDANRTAGTSGVIEKQPAPLESQRPGQQLSPLIFGLH